MSPMRLCKNCGTWHRKDAARCPGCGKRPTDDLRPETQAVATITPETDVCIRQLREAKEQTAEAEIPPENRGQYRLVRGLLRALDILAPRQ